MNDPTIEVICKKCGLPRTPKRCRNCSAEITRRYRANHPERVREGQFQSEQRRKENRQSKVCRKCGQSYIGYKCQPCFNTYMREWCSRNRERLLQKKHEWYQQNKERISKEKIQYQRSSKYWNWMKARVFAAYGNRCYCCGLDDPRFLTVEHLNNDGHKERYPGGRRLTGATVLKRIIDAGFPDSITLACYNCNCARAFFSKGGLCPHRVNKGIELIEVRPIAGITAGLLF